MKYIEVTIRTEENNIDPLTCILMDMGIAGLVVSDPEDVREFLSKKNPYDWDYVDPEVLLKEEQKPGVTFYLDDDENGRALLKQIEERFANEEGGTFSLSSRVADDEEWKDNWKEYFKPAKVTERLVVKPSWEKYERKEGDLVIEIDPGMAFGTGTHATTGMCMQLLENYIDSPKDVVLDVGCGSGILAMAAALLGAERVVGVDLDPVAVEVAKENVAQNSLTDRIEIAEGDLTKGLSLKADIVVANLMADLVIMLAKDVAKHLCGKGIFISSGILVEKRTQVEQALAECGFRILEVREKDGWCAIAAALASQQKGK